MKQPILVDVDGVLTNGFFEKCAKRINDEHGTDFTIQDFDTDLRIVMKDYWNDDCEKWVRSNGFCRDFKPLEESFKLVDGFKERDFHIMYVTSPYRDAVSWGHDRIKWLEEHYGATRDNVILCREKRFVHGFAFIDDLPKNVKNWVDYHKLPGILFERPWNKKDIEDESVYKPYYIGADVDHILRLIDTRICLPSNERFATDGRL